MTTTYDKESGLWLGKSAGLTSVGSTRKEALKLLLKMLRVSRKIKC